jgi:ribosomal protein L37AE/L43A
MTKDVREDQRRAVVRVGRHELRGFVDENPCPNCGARRVYHEKHDAYFCPHCNRWLEGPCSDPSCEYCLERPDTPLP